MKKVAVFLMVAVTVASLVLGLMYCPAMRRSPPAHHPAPSAHEPDPK